jgi:hypothetical protein
MQETKKNPVEEALIQMKNVEEAIAENAKGILASTMKEEINQLVKESLSEQDEVDLDAEIDVDDAEDDVDTEMDTDIDVEDDVDLDADNVDDMDIDMDMDSEETPIDLTDASDEEILKVFKAMGEEDGIIVKKDGENVHLTDNDADVEYLVKLGESKEKSKTKKMKIKENMDLNFDDSNDSQDASTEDVINAIFGGGEMEETEDMEEEYGSKKHEFKRRGGHKMGDVDGHYKDYEMDEEEDMDEVVYEIEFNESDDEELDESDEMEMDESDEMEMDESDEMEMDESEEMEMDESEEMEMDESDDEDDLEESYNPQYVGEGKKLAVKKPKGVGLGHGPKFSYKSSGKGGFKDDKKEGPKTMGTGKAKFEYKKGANMEGKSKVVKKAETKEAARTYGNGSKEGRGLRKGITNNRNYVYSNSGVKVESLEAEVKMLREKNEEYRKALNVFREKLNEVAIFNSNLAYATRLFTEHSTTKKEKINILRRFDDVETLKESKNLYKSLKDELGKTETKTVNESVEKTINNTMSSGSATTLIESKTYENPQFLRMKDLMTKIK